MANAERATGTEPGSRSGAAPAPEDHAFSDALRRAARERDVPLATFTNPGTVAPADRELAHALVLVERTGGQSIQRARLAVRQLLAKRDRVLREPVAMRLPPIAPEKLTGVIRSLAARLEQGLATSSETLDLADLHRKLHDGVLLVELDARGRGDRRAVAGVGGRQGSGYCDVSRLLL